MRILVCGDRYYTNRKLVWSMLTGLWEEVSTDMAVIEGQCPKGGADLFAAEWADLMQNHVEHLPFPAQWDLYGKAAGPIRNQQMLDEGKPDLVIGFHDNIVESKGTKHMLTIAKKAGVETYLISKW